MKVIQIVADLGHGWGVLGLGDDGRMYIWNLEKANWDLYQNDKV